ncbi:MAG: 3-oxoacyl-[acyl-carrier-protein] reductase [Deltaproteobacteria bacterium]|nr:3-oxoacyl-[acyl-carrier-protein] reductase [Deltaproteobacteria bacterium]MBW2642202.1 3-oxoacyl-[acyl-carrier-protein] reductase [Deltaproteobacteria bacterium]
MTEQKQRTIVVTGGSRGIGRAICISLAAPDTRIYFNYFSPSDPDAEAAAAAETEKLVADVGGSAVSSSVNIAEEKEVVSFFEAILDKTGRIDVLVNNAGITKDGLLVRMKEKDWDVVLNINLKGAFTCTRIVAKAMMKQRYGRIINMASVVGVTGNAGQANYSASKAGLIGLTKTVAKELAPRGITVNAIAPGFIETDMTALLSEKARNAMLDQVPLGRAGQPEDVAAVVAFLASESASYLTGQVIHVSGGMYI